MKNSSPIVLVCCSVLTCGVSDAAVIFNDDTIVLGRFPNDSTRLIDIDKNGQTDWIIQLIVPRGFRRGIEIISVSTTDILFEI